MPIHIHSCSSLRKFSNKNFSVSEGHFFRFPKHLSETANHVLAYERNTKFQNLRYERITLIRLKSAKFFLRKPDTCPVYETFLRKPDTIWFTKAKKSGLRSTLAKLQITFWLTNAIRNSKICDTKELLR